MLVPQGSKENPAEQEIELTTEPSENDSTHWGQQVSKNQSLPVFQFNFMNS